MGLFKGKKEEKKSKKNAKNKEVVNNSNRKVYNLKSNGKYEIILEDNFISITAKGFMNSVNKGLTGTKKICLDNVSAVQYKPSGLTTGYLQIILIGSQEVKGGVGKAVKDENTILFTKKETEQILEIKEYIENYISNKNNNSNQNTPSAADELMKFKKLLDMGAITEEEYENKKEQILKL